MVAEATRGRAGGTGGGRGGLLLDMPGAVVPRLRTAAATTPGRLSLIMVGLALLAVLTGVLGLITLQGKADTLSDLTTHREPVNAAAQQIYRSLSDADATAASASLSGSVEPAVLRDRYYNDIQQAGVALSVAATDTSGAGSQAGVPVGQLSAGLPVYTGLVAQAVANNAQGYPASSAYLREADNLMRTTLLPAAAALYSADTALVASEQSDADAFPWLLTLLVVALIVALVLAQRFLSRRTNRTFNVGLVLASAAVLLVVLWASVGLVMSAVFVGRGADTGSTPVTLLTQARAKALQARTDEMLTLVARGGVNYGSEFLGLANDIGGQNGSGGLLGQVAALNPDPVTSQQVTAATAAAKSWFELHGTVTSADESGRYDEAVAIALGTNPQLKESNAFYQLDAALANAIQQSRKNFLDETGTAANWLVVLPVGVLVLGLIAAAGSILGIWQRLKEYR